MLYKKCHFDSNTNEYLESEWVQGEELSKTISGEEGVYQWFESSSKKTYLLYSGTEADSNGYDGIELMHVSSDSVLSLIKYFIENRKFFRENIPLDICAMSEMEDIDYPDNESFIVISKINKV